MNIFKSIVAVPIVILLLLSSCSKDSRGYGENPYEGGKEQLGIAFQNLNRPVLEARPNDIVKVNVRGLKGDNVSMGDLKAYVNNELTEIVAVTDSTLEFRLPSKVSSGPVKLMVKDQLFFGPRIPIEGKVNLDKDYGVSVGFNGPVSQILPVNNNFWVVGLFNNFENESTNSIFRNSIHLINSNGKSQSHAVGKGPSLGIVRSISPLSDGKFYIGGIIDHFQTGFKDYEIFGVSRILSNGILDTLTGVEIANSDLSNLSKSFDTVPAFNAELYGGVLKVFTGSDNSLYAIGSLSMHSYINYNYSSKDTRMRLYSNVKSIAKIRPDGRLDSSFNYNNAGVNGYINDAVQLKDGTIVAVGAFTSYNGVQANRIIALDKNGKVSTTFNTGVGADDEIFAITYNADRNKIAIAGRFKTFNNSNKYGVVILNADGSVDQSFTLRDTEQKTPNYAYYTKNNKVLVTGDFKKYDGVNRSQLLLLEQNGEALQEYNNIGSFSGIIYSVVETQSSKGNPALLIGGFISTADDAKVGNIFRLEIKN